MEAWRSGDAMGVVIQRYRDLEMRCKHRDVEAWKSGGVLQV